MSIRVSEKYGVNPAIPKCFICNQDKKELILAGRLAGDREAPQGMVWDKQPCDTCRRCMDQGVILISVDSRKTEDRENPWRSGGWVVVKDEAVQRWIEAEANPVGQAIWRQVLAQRIGFIEDAVWDMIGLPRGEVEGIPNELPSGELS